MPSTLYNLLFNETLATPKWRGVSFIGKTAAEEAKGIPSRTEYGDINKLTKDQLATLLIQKHDALKAKTHYDVRLGTPETGLYSWATKKELPQPGKKIAVFQQPLHTWDYKDFEGKIPEGEYGAGNVAKFLESGIVITKVDPKYISFTKLNGRYVERFTLVKPTNPEGKAWLLINTTPNKPATFTKEHYKLVAPEKVDERIKSLKPGDHVQAKIDGALGIVDLLKDTAEVSSHRTSKVTGSPVIHTERVFGTRPQLDIPKEWQNSRLLGEVYAKQGDKVLPVQELSAILNSRLNRSRQTLEDKDAQLKIRLYNILTKGGKDVTQLPYSQREQLMRAAAELAPETFEAPESVTNVEDAQKLLKQVKSGKHPLTGEGLVIHPEVGTPEKLKLPKETDVYIKGFYPGEGQRASTIGGFEYSREPEGAVVGRVGSGLSNALLKEMADEPDYWTGRIARVEHEGEYPSGALRAPRLLTTHEG